jgi:integrase
MTSQRITKRMVDALKPNGSEFTLWDDRLRPTGAMSYVVVLQGRRRSRCAGAALYHRRGRENRTGQARARAKAVLCSVAHGHDPAGQKTTERGVPTIAELADRFMAESRDNRSASFIRRSPIPRSKPIVYSQWSAVCTHSRHGPLSCPKGLEKFKESCRERFLTAVELERLGSAIREAETTGIPRTVDCSKPKAKHLPKSEKRFTKINPFAAAALRLLTFTGCRLREILNFRWKHVDMEIGLLFLPDSKSGRKTVILSAPALAILNGLERTGPYVVPGDDPAKPRPDLKRPWDAITKRAGLDGVRLHDLRHTYVSFGAGGGLALPIIGRLLGHTQTATTARYAHLDNDPLRRASESIAGRIAAALDGNGQNSVVPIRRRANA